MEVARAASLQCETGARDVRPHVHTPSTGNVAALERSDNVAHRGHAFALLKRGYPASQPDPSPDRGQVDRATVEPTIRNRACLDF